MELLINLVICQCHLFVTIMRELLMNLSWSTLLMVNVYLLNHTYTTGIEVRGQYLLCYAFIEYTCCIAIVKRPQQSEEQVSISGGRPPNGCYLFDPAHPLYDFYYQKICSKQSTPILASVKPPPNLETCQSHAPGFGP